MKYFFKKRLQLASVSIHSSVFGVEPSDPVRLSHGQNHGVLAVDLLQDGHGHVGDLVARPVVVGADGLVQPRHGLSVRASHRDPMLVHPRSEFRNSFPAVLLATSLLLAGDAVDHPGGSAVDGRVDDGHGVRLRGPDLLALLDVVARGAVAALLHPFDLTLRPRIRVRGRGHFGSDKLVSE